MSFKFTKVRVGLEVTIFSQQQSQGLAVSRGPHASDEHLLATSTGAVLALPGALSVLARLTLSLDPSPRASLSLCAPTAASDFIRKWVSELFAPSHTVGEWRSQFWSPARVMLIRELHTSWPWRTDLRPPDHRQGHRTKDSRIQKETRADEFQSPE